MPLGSWVFVLDVGSLWELIGVVVLSCCPCAWLSMLWCGLAEEEWEESGDAVLSWVPCWCPGEGWLDRCPVQGLFDGGGGGGAPGRCMGALIEVGSS